MIPNKNSKESNDKTPNEHEDGTFCAVTNPATGQYIDLSQLSSTPNLPGTKKKSKTKPEPKTRWLVKGYGPDIDKNFTISICSSPVIPDNDETKKLSNLTGAYYSVNNTKTNKIEVISIGNFNTKPKLFGNKKLTLQYEQGSKCPNGLDKRSTLLSFVCDREITSRAQINYIGNSNNCSYFFEVKSIYACPTAIKSNDINVLGIFLAIIFVFTLVELCRRWIKKKIERNSISGPIMSSRGNNIYDNTNSGNYYDYRASHSSNNDDNNNNNYAEPQWELLEDKSVINRWITRIQGMWPINIRRNDNSSLSFLVSSPYNGSIRLDHSNILGNNNSTSSFFRDMETQNGILDQLDNLNESQGSSVRSSVYTGSSVNQSTN